MKYETPEMKVLLLKAEDIVTVSDNGVGGDEGENGNEGGSTEVPEGSWN